jgi:hypothetical protein
MYRQILIAALAQAALAEFRANQLVGINIAADVGETACAAIEVVASSCVDSIPNFTNAPVLTQEKCLCCFSATNIAPVYGACASWIGSSAPQFSVESSGEFPMRELPAGDADPRGGAC